MHTRLNILNELVILTQSCGIARALITHDQRLALLNNKMSLIESIVWFHTPVCCETVSFLRAVGTPKITIYTRTTVVQRSKLYLALALALGHYLPRLWLTRLSNINHVRTQSISESTNRIQVHKTVLQRKADLPFPCDSR
jgi:hypothetical protein